jgi:hypothetical protein
MWGHISRFIDDEGSTAEASFDALLGENASAHRARWAHLAGQDREDEVVRTYCERVRTVGGFAHCVSTVVVNPTKDRTHYHLVYATRSRRGLVTFREIERKVTPHQQEARARAKQRLTEAKTGQLGLLAPTDMDTGYIVSLMRRYQTKARSEVERTLQASGEVPYDALVDLALAWPLTCEADLKKWIQDLVSAGRASVHGLEPRKRALQIGAGHSVRQLG